MHVQLQFSEFLSAQQFKADHQ